MDLGFQNERQKGLNPFQGRYFDVFEVAGAKPREVSSCSCSLFSYVTVVEQTKISDSDPRVIEFH